MMLKYRFLIFVLLAFLSYELLAQNGGSGTYQSRLTLDTFMVEETFQKSQVDSLIKWQERVALQLNKEVLMPKEVLFFKANILTGPNQLRASASNVLRVELLDEQGKLLKSQNHRITNGVSSGSLEIPRKVKDGTYYLRAYTRWMLNYGPDYLPIKKVQIGNVNPQTGQKGIEFYPEGGSLVMDLENRLVIKSEKGLGNEFRIINEQNQIVSDVIWYGDQLYSAMFTPKEGSQYYLASNGSVKLALPKINDLGYTLQLNNLDDEFFDLRVQKSQELMEDGLFVTVTSGGVKYLESKVDFKGGSSIDLKMPKTVLPNGLFKVSLVDDFDQVLAERPLRITSDDLKIEVIPLSNETQEKNKSFKIQVTDSQGKPIATELGIGIYSQESSENISKQNTLGKKTEDNKRIQRYVDDLSVLTYDFANDLGMALKSDFPEEIDYNFQNGLEFYGQAYDLNDDLLTNVAIQILINTDEEAIIREKRTDANGMFKLSEIDVEGEATMVFRTAGEESKSKLVRVRPYKYEVPPFEIAGKSVEKRQTELVRPKRITWNSDAFANEKDVIALKGVTLVEQKFKKVTKPSFYGIEPLRKVFQDPDRPKSIPQLFLGIPGFQVSNLGDLNPTLRVPMSMGIGPILWVIDGFPLSQENVRPEGGVGRISPLREVMDLVSYMDVDRIEILDGADAAIYGSRAAGGAILIYTRDGDTDDYYNRKDAQLTFQGYHESIDFLNYKSSQKRNKRKQGLSETLYWNPAIRTNEKGETIIEVEIPDQLSKIRFEALAITPDGKSGRSKGTL